MRFLPISSKFISFAISSVDTTCLFVQFRRFFLRKKTKKTLKTTFFQLYSKLSLASSLDSLAFTRRRIFTFSPASTTWKNTEKCQTGVRLARACTMIGNEPWRKQTLNRRAVQQTVTLAMKWSIAATRETSVWLKKIFKKSVRLPFVSSGVLVYSSSDELSMVSSSNCSSPDGATEKKKITNFSSRNSFCFKPRFKSRLELGNVDCDMFLQSSDYFFKKN